jgi:hypothetical protein
MIDGRIGVPEGPFTNIINLFIPALRFSVESGEGVPPRLETP